MKIKDASDFYATRYIRHSNVTGSFTLYSVHWPNGENVRFFVDAGIKQGENNIGFYNAFIPFNTEKISFGIVTHNHMDHIGLLPVLISQAFRGPIFTSYSTAQLMGIALNDTITIVDKDLGRPISNEQDVEQTLDQLVGCTYKKQIKPHKNIRITFYSNGHLVGATVVLIVITCPGREPITIIHTGDYKDKNVFFNVEMPPKAVRELNISNIVCESTYGNVDSKNPMFQKCLEKNTVEALKNGMTVIYPTFAQGRHQEVLSDIMMWKKKGIIPGNIPVIVDGKSSQEYNFQYRFADLGIKKIMRNFMPKDSSFIPRGKNKNMYRKQLMSDSGPKIILAPGGMASYGPITSYIKYGISRDDVLVHSLGYCSPESTMYKLLHTEDGETLKYQGESVVKKCIVKQTAEKSSHAPRDVLLKFLEYFPNTCSVSINHGEANVQLEFRDYLLEHLELEEEQITVANPAYGVRIESNGITDVFETHFESIL